MINGKKITNEDIDQDAGVTISLRKYVYKCKEIIKKYKEAILVCLTITSYQTTDKKKRIFR